MNDIKDETPIKLPVVWDEELVAETKDQLAKLPDGGYLYASPLCGSTQLKALADSHSQLTADLASAHEQIRQQKALIKRYEWLSGEAEYIQLQGETLIDIKDGEGFVVILHTDDEFDRRTLGAFDTLSEAIQALQGDK